MANHNARILIDKIEYDALTISEANKKILGFVSSPKKSSYCVVKPYVEYHAKAHQNSDFEVFLRSCDLVVADGTSAQWAASYLYGAPQKAFARLLRSLFVWQKNANWIQQVLPDRMAGVNQTIPLLKLCEKHRIKVGILGGPRDTERTKQALREKFRNLDLEDVWSGYFQINFESKTIAEIKSARLDILFVAMGMPRQEIFMAKYRDSGLAKALIAEGGSFDFDSLGGKLKRAPIFVQKARLEWLWRLILQPKRLVRQIAIPSFIIRIYQQSRKSA